MPGNKSTTNIRLEYKWQVGGSVLILIRNAGINKGIGIFF